MALSAVARGLLLAMVILRSVAKDERLTSRGLNVDSGIGAWSDWSSWSTCSRSCGGGVSMRSRMCQKKLASRGEPMCHGESMEHKICNRKECELGAKDYRHYQCSQYNNRKVAGQTTREWLPQNGVDHNPCELRCHSPSLGLAYSFGKAADGTNCSPGRDDVCINGRCMPVGCDDLIGSKVGLDMCGVCGGRNVTCIHYKDVYLGQPEIPGDSESESRVGYHEVSVIPVGATHIYIHHDSTNYIAIRDRANAMVFNRRPDMPDHLRVAGTTIAYTKHDNNSETLKGPGPTDQDLYVMVLLRDRNPGIYYEYWLPKDNHQPRRVVPPRTNTRWLSTSTVDYSWTSLRTTTFRPQLPPTRPSEGIAILATTKPGRKSETSPSVPLHPTAADPIQQSSSDRTVHERRPDYPSTKPGLSTSRPSHVSINSHGRDYNRYWTNNRSRWTYSWYDEQDHSQTVGKGRATPTPITVAVLQLPDTSRNFTRRGQKTGRCLPCHRVKDQIRNFCKSDFVLRVTVVDYEMLHGETRYEMEVLQSYKNKMAILPREFIWTADGCRCPKLRVGREYVIMGKEAPFRRNESRLLVDRDSFVRPYTLKNDRRLLRLRREQKRKCLKVS